MKKKILTLLVLLMTAVTGAWAQATFVVKEITADMVPSTWNGDETMATPQDMAALGFDFVDVTLAEAKAWADYPTSGRVTLLHTYSSGASCFYSVDWDGGSYFGTAANYRRTDIYSYVNKSGYKTFITVAPEPGVVTWNAATKTGTFLMPGYDVELEVAYFNITAPTANTTDGDIHAGTATPLINAGSTTEEGATIKYLVTATNEQPTSTDGFSATVPTAEAITAPGTYYVWYYLDFATGDDSDISAQAIQVTVADYLDYTISLAKGTEDAGKWNIEPKEAKPGTEIKATYTGTKHVKSVRAVKKAPAPVAEGHEYVDLGLPSGLLWATCNVGADTPEAYGDYFAWGETTTKTTYNWSTYQYCNGSNTTLTKYCNNSSYGNNGFTDNLTTLLPEDDAAAANWGGNWRMPTKEEWQELLGNTTVTWTTQNGVNGRLFTAKNGSGNSLFLPAAGNRRDGGLDDAGAWGYYWSSSLGTNNPRSAWYITFGSDSSNMYGGNRCGGFPVRPVREN